MNDDRLFQFASALGAEAAWLLRGSDRALLRYGMPEVAGLEIALIEEFGTVLLVMRFPDDGSDESGLKEMRLPGTGDREMQAMALLAASLDALTRIGPNTTVRAIRWAFARYGIKWPQYGGPWTVLDRRPSKPSLPPPPPPAPEQMEQPEASGAPTGGRQLRERRLTLGLSQRQLGERVGLSQGRVSHIESGASPVDAELVTRLEQAIAAFEAEREEGVSE